MSWMDWVRYLQMTDLDEDLLPDSARIAEQTGKTIREAAQVLPFGRTPLDFARSFATLATQEARK